MDISRGNFRSLKPFCHSLAGQGACHKFYPTSHACGSSRTPRAHHTCGGQPVALGQLPTTSVEGGRDDPVLKALWDSLFDTEPTLARWTMRSNTKNGRAYFVSSSVAAAVALLAEITDHDVDVVKGPAERLSVLHKNQFFRAVDNFPST